MYKFKRIQVPGSQVRKYAVYVEGRPLPIGLVYRIERDSWAIRKDGPTVFTFGTRREAADWLYKHS